MVIHPNQISRPKWRYNIIKNRVYYYNIITSFGDFPITLNYGEDKYRDELLIKNIDNNSVYEIIKHTMNIKYIHLWDDKESALKYCSEFISGKKYLKFWKFVTYESKLFLQIPIKDQPSIE